MITLEKNGLKKNVSTGFSWKSLCFGFLYPVVRGDFKGAARHFIYSSITLGVNWFITPFFYNTKYIKGLIEEGYKPCTAKSKDYLSKKSWYSTVDSE